MKTRFDLKKRYNTYLPEIHCRLHVLASPRGMDRIKHHFDMIYHDRNAFTKILQEFIQGKVYIAVISNGDLLKVPTYSTTLEAISIIWESLRNPAVKKHFK